MRNNISFRLAMLSSAIIAIAIVATFPMAHADVVSHARIVRLSFVEGDVAYQSPGSPWQRAVMNLPLQQGFSVRTDTGNAEVEFESGLVVQLAGNTQLEFKQLSLIDGHKVTSLKLDQGTMIATANLEKGDDVSISSGNGDVRVPRSGRFRIDSAQSQSWVTVFRGRVDVADGGSNTEVDNGKTLHFGSAAADGGADQSSVDRSPRTDAFDKWASDREQAQDNAQAGAGEFLRQRDYQFSTADLYNYGLWSNISGFGMAWQPYGMGANWMPFSNGMWMFDDIGAGWMWASAEPWGWTPYHYGGWVYLDGEGWFWIPQNLGSFYGGTASFVNVGNQVGWTPTAPTPANPKKVKIAPVTPTNPLRIVFAGGGSKGVIVAGPRGVVPAASTVNIASGPAATFVQASAPSVAALGTAGVTVTSRGPQRPVSTLAYSPRGTSAGTGAPTSGAPGNLGAPSNLNAPNAGRPTAVAPHSSPMPVMRAPSTFAVAGSGSRSSGVTPVVSSQYSGGSRSGGASGVTSTSSASNGSSAGTTGHATGTTGTTAPPATSTTSTGTAPAGKH
jgi:FecR protein